MAWSILALGAVLPAAAQESLVIRQAGGDVVVPMQPRHTVAVDLATIDTLSVLGVEVQGVPTLPKWPDRLAKYAGEKFLKVGSLFAPNLEVIQAAAPQVIFVGGRSSRRAAELARLAPVADMSVDVSHLAEDVMRNAGILGKLYGKEDEAARRVGALRSAIAAVRARAAAAGTSLLILASRGEMFAQGPGMRYGFLHDGLGLRPAVQDFSQAGERGLPLTVQDIGRMDPEWIFVIDRDRVLSRPDAEPAGKLLDREPVHRTRAWRNGRVVYLDGFDWYLLGNAGLGALQRTVDQVGTVLGIQH
ncbi:siderophore ABC transporter substrate-binding protein [Bordetella sp. 2513F-2]